MCLFCKGLLIDWLQDNHGAFRSLEGELFMIREELFNKHIIIARWEITRVGMLCESEQWQNLVWWGEGRVETCMSAIFLCLPIIWGSCWNADFHPGTGVGRHSRLCLPSSHAMLDHTVGTSGYYRARIKWSLVSGRDEHVLIQSTSYLLTPNHPGRGKGIDPPTSQLVFRHVDSSDKTFTSSKLTISAHFKTHLCV